MKPAASHLSSCYFIKIQGKNSSLCDCLLKSGIQLQHLSICLLFSRPNIHNLKETFPPWSPSSAHIIFWSSCFYIGPTENWTQTLLDIQQLCCWCLLSLGFFKDFIESYRYSSKKVYIFFSESIYINIYLHINIYLYIHITIYIVSYQLFHKPLMLIQELLLRTPIPGMSREKYGYCFWWFLYYILFK